MEDTQVESRTKVLKNGAVYDLDRGRIVSSKNVTTKITSENAVALSRKRHEANRRAVVRAVVGEAQSIDPTVQTPADAYGLLMANQYTKLLDSQKPDVGQAEKLGKIMTGMDLEISQRENTPPPPGSIIADPDALHRLLELIEADKRQAVDRARAVDATDTRNDE
jgi:hypothetical protein